MAITQADAADLLTIAAAYDKRTIGYADAVAWAYALSDLHPAECRQAIHAYYRHMSRMIMPADVREIVVSMREQDALKLRGEQLHAEYEAGQLIDQDAAHRALLECRDAFARATGRPTPTVWGEYGDCPHCHAHRGEPCTVNERPRGTPHPSRPPADTDPGTEDRRTA